MNDLTVERELLTDEQKLFLQRLFWDHQEKINKQLNEELTILSKYKGELARNYAQVGAYQNTLVGCMKDIIENQESLAWIMRDLIKVITGQYPESKGRVDAEEYQK